MSDSIVPSPLTSPSPHDSGDDYVGNESDSSSDGAEPLRLGLARRLEQDAGVNQPSSGEHEEAAPQRQRLRGEAWGDARDHGLILACAASQPIAAWLVRGAPRPPHAAFVAIAQEAWPGKKHEAFLVRRRLIRLYGRFKTALEHVPRSLRVLPYSEWPPERADQVPYWWPDFYAKIWKSTSRSPAGTQPVASMHDAQPSSAVASSPTTSLLSSRWERAQQFPIRKMRTPGWNLSLEGKLLNAVASSEVLAPWLRDRQNRRPDHLYDRLTDFAIQQFPGTRLIGTELAARLDLIHVRCKEFASTLPANLLGQPLAMWSSEAIAQLQKCQGMPPSWDTWYENVALHGGEGYPPQWKASSPDEPAAAAAGERLQPAPLIRPATITQSVPSSVPRASRSSAEARDEEVGHSPPASAAHGEARRLDSALPSSLGERDRISASPHTSSVKDPGFANAGEVFERLLRFTELRAWLVDGMVAPMPVPKDFKNGLLCLLLSGSRTYYDQGYVTERCRKVLNSLDSKYQRKQAFLSAHSQQLPTAQWEGEDKDKLAHRPNWFALWHDQVALARRERSAVSGSPLPARRTALFSAPAPGDRESRDAASAQPVARASSFASSSRSPDEPMHKRPRVSEDAADTTASSSQRLSATQRSHLGPNTPSRSSSAQTTVLDVNMSPPSASGPEHLSSLKQAATAKKKRMLDVLQLAADLPTKLRVFSDKSAVRRFMPLYGDLCKRQVFDDDNLPDEAAEQAMRDLVELGLEASGEGHGEAWDLLRALSKAAHEALWSQ